MSGADSGATIRYFRREAGVARYNNGKTTETSGTGHGNQPYTTSGLAITRTLPETSPPIFYSSESEHHLFGPVACFNTRIPWARYAIPPGYAS